MLLWPKLVWRNGPGLTPKCGIRSPLSWAEDKSDHWAQPTRPAPPSMVERLKDRAWAAHQLTGALLQDPRSPFCLGEAPRGKPGPSDGTTRKGKGDGKRRWSTGAACWHNVGSAEAGFPFLSLDPSTPRYCVLTADCSSGKATGQGESRQHMHI